MMRLLTCFRSGSLRCAEKGLQRMREARLVGGGGGVGSGGGGSSKNPGTRMVAV